MDQAKSTEPVPGDTRDAIHLLFIVALTLFSLLMVSGGRQLTIKASDGDGEQGGIARILPIAGNRARPVYPRPESVAFRSRPGGWAKLVAAPCPGR